RVWMGTASGHADGWHGGSRGDFRGILSRAYRRSLEPERHCSRGAAHIDRHQLLWSARRQQFAERAYVVEDCCNRGTGDHWICCWRTRTGGSEIVGRKAVLIRSSEKYRRSDGSDRLRVRWLADRHVCRGRNTRSVPRFVAWTADRCLRRCGALSCSEPG